MERAPQNMTRKRERKGNRKRNLERERTKGKCKENKDK